MAHKGTQRQLGLFKQDSTSTVREDGIPVYRVYSAYVLYPIRKKNHLADNLNGVRFLLWFYFLSFLLVLFFDFVHFILGILDKEFYVVRSSYIMTVLASGPISFVFYLVKCTR